MTRLIIYYVQLDTQDIHEKNYEQVLKYDVMNVYIMCTDKTILKTIKNYLFMSKNIF